MGATFEGTTIELEEFTKELDQTVSELEGESAEDSAARPRVRSASGDRVTLKIQDQNGVLIVDDGYGRRVRGDVRPWNRQLTKLDRAQIGSWLESVDRKLTPARGLRRFHEGSLTPVDNPPGHGRVLLLVHGTFSSCDNLLGSIEANRVGEEFLRWGSQNYDQILTFDHPTLQVSPTLNAFELARLFGRTSASIDVVCHSRGGLVVRWWLDALDREQASVKRVVFVGSPLAGTSLASPPHIKGSLSLLANISSALGVASSAIPFMVALAGVFKVVASVTKVAAKTPAIDAALALIPGLIAQSRVGNNEELHTQRRLPIEWADRYYAVQSNFESTSPGWRFWEYFRGIGPRARDALADVVFDGPNDLVVDTGAMTEFSSDVWLPESHVYDFGSSELVHHTNYFGQPQTLNFIMEKLTVRGQSP